nr:hypothetical protein [Tanacetum cinerariifolium]
MKLKSKIENIFPFITKYVVEDDEKYKQRNLYKALVEAYESDKIIIDTYRETVTLKRRRDDDANKDEEPFAGPDRGSKRRREGKEPESVSAPTETATRSASRSTQGSRSRQALASESALAEEPMQTTSQMEEPSCLEFDTGAEDQPIVQSSQHPEWFSQQHKPPSSDRDWNKTVPAVHESIQPRIIVVTELKIVECHSYKHLDWIMVRKDDDKIYKFKEDDFKRLRIQEIEDMLLLLVQGKLTNMIVKNALPLTSLFECLQRSIMIQRRMEDLQLGVKSYQKKLNQTKPDSYQFDLKRKEAYTAYSNPRGFIYQIKDKRNRLMRIDELHKFSDRTLTDVRTALDDRLKGIQMQYLPQLIWRKSDKDRTV